MRMDAYTGKLTFKQKLGLAGKPLFLGVLSEAKSDQKQRRLPVYPMEKAEG